MDTLKSTISRLSELFEYDALTGSLYWRERPESLFKSDHDANVWNTRYAGQPAINYIDANGYRVGEALGQSLKAHRVVWEIHHGEAPEHIDHINGNKSDNRIENLRSVSHAGNMKNVKRRSDNKSGSVGVRSYRGKWRAQIAVNGRNQHLGTFDCKDAAIAARKAAEAHHDYHENHGRA